MKNKLSLLAILATLSSASYAASIDHIQTYSPDYLANQAQTGMINSVSANYNPAGTTRLENGKYVHAGLQYAMGHEQMTYKGTKHRAKLRQAIPDISFVSVDKDGAYFATFGGIAGGGSLNYKDSVAGIRVMEDINSAERPFKLLGVHDNGSRVEGSNKYEQLTLGRAFNVNDKLSFSVAGRVVHGTRRLSGDLNLGLKPDFNALKVAANVQIEAITKAELAKKLAENPNLANISAQLETGIRQKVEAEVNKKLADKKAALEKLNYNLVGNIDSEREAWGYGFQLGVNYKATEKLNLAARYDSRVKLNFKAKGNENLLPTKALIGGDIGLSSFFPQYKPGTKSRRDLPAILSLGASYQATDKWLVSTAGNFYFNRQAKMDRNVDHVSTDYKNGWEVAVGNEYKLNDKVTLISSVNYAKTGANKKTYSDIEYALNSLTVGAGVRYKFNETLEGTFSVAHFFYEGAKGNFKDKYGVSENQKYKKDITAVGVSFTKKF